MSDSSWPHESQHNRPPCPLPTPRVNSNSCPLSQWCQPPHALFSPSPPALNLSQHQGLFQLVGSSHQVAEVLKLQLQYQSFQWIFPSGLIGLTSLLSKWLSRAFSSTTVQKHQFFGAQLSSQPNSHPYMTTGKTIALTRWIFVGKVMSLLLNMLSGLVITFLPRSKCLLISWLQSPIVFPQVYGTEVNYCPSVLTA